MLIKGCGLFTDFLWESVENIFNEIINLPFYRQLSLGTLPESVFKEYLQQDILYLKEDTKAIFITSERAPEISEKIFLKRLVTAGIALEEDLHNELSEKFGAAGNIHMNNACRSYSTYLVNTANKGLYEESVSALLPCYWVYQNAGLISAAASAADNPYQLWLDAYSGDQFTAFTGEYIRITEKIAERSDSRTKKFMENAFIRGTKYELEFIKSISV